MFKKTVKTGYYSDFRVKNYKNKGQQYICANP